MNASSEVQPSPLTNVEAEAALLGALMVSNALIPAVSHVVEPADFSLPVHGRVYRVILKLHDAGKIASPITLRPAFELDPGLADMGGAGYLAQLTGSGAGIIGARDFAEQVRDLARLRDVKDSVERGLEAIGDEGNLEDFLAEVEIATARASTTLREIPVHTAADMIGMAETRARTSLESGVPGASCKTVADMDTLLGRLEGGQMTILAGRPGMGKSTLSMSSMLGYALNGEPCMYALAESSAEMFSLKFTADLLHASNNPVAFRTLKEGILSNEERRSLRRAEEIAASLPITFAHIGRSDIKRLEALVAREASRLKRQERKLKVLFVDYLQLLTADGRHRVGDDRGRVNAVSEGLLAIAQRYDCHVVALSQLSRQVEQREDKRPRLSDLRESGRLEEDCDNCLMVYREEYYLEKAKPTVDKDLEAWEIEMAACRGKIELIAVKTRFGSNASRRCHFIGDHSAVRGSNFHSSDTIADDDLFNAFEEGGR